MGAHPNFIFSNRGILLDIKSDLQNKSIGCRQSVREFGGLHDRAEGGGTLLAEPSLRASGQQSLQLVGLGRVALLREEAWVQQRPCEGQRVERGEGLQGDNSHAQFQPLPFRY